MRWHDFKSSEPSPGATCLVLRTDLDGFRLDVMQYDGVGVWYDWLNGRSVFPALPLWYQECAGLGVWESLQKTLNERGVRWGGVNH